MDVTYNTLYKCILLWSIHWIIKIGKIYFFSPRRETHEQMTIMQILFRWEVQEEQNYMEAQEEGAGLK